MIKPHRLAAYLLLCAALYACRPAGNTPCRAPEGAWINPDGFQFVFLPENNMLWLTQFGTQYDTVHLRYTLDCGTAPAGLDLSNFDAGPHRGKTLYGIMEWTSDSSFRFRYEQDARPAVFDSDQTMRFVRRD